MSLRLIGIATLALLGSAYGADSCCFIVQDEAHEVYWAEYVTDVYTVIANAASTIVATTSSLVNKNPVALYPNPAFAIPQNTEILHASVPTKTGGLTIASPTGFWAYPTIKVFAAPAVTDSNGNIACGTVSSFSQAPTDPAACVPTFTGINSNAAAYFHGNNRAQIVEITLTTPFIHVPTRAALKIGPSEACAQGNGVENYGYPVQQLISHLAGNKFYSAQYPGIETCLPAGPSIQRLLALAETTETPTGGGLTDPTTTSGAASTETPDPGTELTSVTTTTTSDTQITTSTTSSVSITTSETSTPGPETTPTTLTTSTTSPPTALPQPGTTTSSPTTVETPFESGGLLPGTTTPSALPSTVAPESAVTTASSTTAGSDTSLSVTTPESVTTEITTVSVVPLPSSELPSSTESQPASTTSPEEPSTSEASIEITSSTATPVVVNGTSTGITPGETQTTPSPGFEASAIRGYVFWELMMGLIGFAVLGSW